jgi:hypothetical protein
VGDVQGKQAMAQPYIEYSLADAIGMPLTELPPFPWPLHCIKRVQTEKVLQGKEVNI